MSVILDIRLLQHCTQLRYHYTHFLNEYNEKKLNLSNLYQPKCPQLSMINNESNIMGLYLCELITVAVYCSHSHFLRHEHIMFALCTDYTPIWPYSTHLL